MADGSPERPRARWGDEPVKEAFKKDENADRETAYTPPERLREEGASIDPGTPDLSMSKIERKFPKLEPIIKKLREREEKYIAGWNPEAFKGEEFSQYADLIPLIKYALLYRAIVENWDAKTLYRQYDEKMYSLHDAIASRPLFHELVGKLIRGFNWLTQGERIGMDGKNEHLNDREIQPSERISLVAKMRRLELEKHQKIIEPVKKADEDREDDDKKLKTDELGLVENVYLPFYRLYYIDRAIVENRPKTSANKYGMPDAIFKDYSVFVEDEYKGCIKE